MKEDAPASLEEGAAGDGRENVCRTYLELSAKGCEPKKIYWTGKNYEIAIEEAVAEVNEQK